LVIEQYFWTSYSLAVEMIESGFFFAVGDVRLQRGVEFVEIDGRGVDAEALEEGSPQGAGRDADLQALEVGGVVDRPLAVG
jgi:hypothetical protein